MTERRKLPRPTKIAPPEPAPEPVPERRPVPEPSKPPKPPRPPRRPKPEPEPQTTPAALGSYGNPSIDQHDRAFIAAADEVNRRYGIALDPRVLKAIMGVESGHDGNYPPDRCRPRDSYDSVPACGPMQIKFPYHRHKCPDCDLTTVDGQIRLAAHILGLEMAKGLDAEQAFLSVYFPGDDPGTGTTQRDYIEAMRGMVAKMGATPERPMTPALDPWRPYPFPAMVDLVVDKPYEAAGFDRVAFRRPLIRGSCDHITEGDASIEWYAAFFSTGGERARDALVDTVIGRDGRIGLLNDWRDPQRGGTRAGWANGGTNGLEGIGIPFYRKFPSVNVHLVSKEHVARSGQPLTDAQVAASIELSAAIAQEARCSWQTFPVHQEWDVDIQQYHAAFATKSCPTPLFLTKYRPVIVAAIKAKLKAWQGGLPAPEPSKPAPPWEGPFGLPLEHFANEFGTLTQFNPDGTTTEFRFDPKGTISLAWLKRCEEEGVLPEAQQWKVWDSNLAPGKEHWVSFANGWRLFLPIDNERSGWRWVDQEVTAKDGVTS